ncbi:hypothetical protein [Kribbella sp. NPDC003557]|uniref:hypothetical protein n=1 Tax=Kribbella sp. NPDC003557 TaxID=3154449 RepID=UPI0033A72925
MTTPDRRDVPLDDDRMLDADDLEPDPDLTGRRATDNSHPDNNYPDGNRTDDRRMDDDRTGDRVGDQPEQAVRTASRDPLVAQNAAFDFRARWDVVQQGFVDDPRNAVVEADKLVDDVLRHLADGFDRQRQDLEHQWSGGEPSTEDLRSALQRYRAFFQRLLTL